MIAALCGFSAALAGFSPDALAAIRALVERPPAVEGAPVLVPVRVEGDEPPVVSLRAELERGETVPCEGRLLWPVRPDAGDGRARWAIASNELRFVAERPAGATDAFLAIELPADSLRARAIALPTGSVAPLWIDPAPIDLFGRLAPRMGATVARGAPDPLLSRPDPDAPFERFRFAIGCALRGWDEPPALDPSKPDAIVARATTALWLAALARVERASTGTAAELAESLIATCRDDSTPAPIAAWIADPTELATVLSLAIDPEREDAGIAERVASWLGVRSPLILWVEDETRDEVVLKIANPTSAEEVVRLSWLNTLWLDENEAPLAALVPPVEIARVRLARPTRPTGDDARPAASDERDELRIEHRGQARAIPLSPIALPVGTFGQSITTFRRPLNLVTAATGIALDAPESLRTTASLRPRLEGWEIFVEARCAGAPTALDSLRIVGAGGTAITVRGDGSVEDPSGVLAGASVEWKVYPDRFRLGLQVPTKWISRVDGSALVELGFRRTGRGGAADAPFASVPWRDAPRPVAFDLLARD